MKRQGNLNKEMRQIEEFFASCLWTLVKAKFLQSVAFMGSLHASGS